MSPVLFGRRASDRRVPDISDRLSDNLAGSPHQCQPQQREGAVKKKKKKKMIALNLSSVST